MAVLGPSNCSQMGRKQLYSTKKKQTANEEDHKNNLAGGPHTAVGINWEKRVSSFQVNLVIFIWQFL